MKNLVEAFKEFAKCVDWTFVSVMCMLAFLAVMTENITENDFCRRNLTKNYYQNCLKVGDQLCAKKTEDLIKQCREDKKNG